MVATFEHNMSVGGQPTASQQPQEETLAHVLTQANQLLAECESLVYAAGEKLNPQPTPDAQTKESEPQGVYSVSLHLRNRASRIKNALLVLNGRLG